MSRELAARHCGIYFFKYTTSANYNVCNGNRTQSLHIKHEGTIVALPGIKTRKFLVLKYVIWTTLVYDARTA